MKIATFNINSIRNRLPRLLEWLKVAKPDAVCLQELRIYHEEFPIDAIRNAGYGALWQGQKPRYNGVAILARGREPVEIRRGLPGDPGDIHARYLEAAVEGIVIGCIYAPNGNPQPGPKFDFKLAWLERLIAHAALLYKSGAPVVLAGDYNVVPTEADTTPRHRMITMHSCNRKVAQHSVAFWIRDGSTPSACGTRPNAYIRIGITCASAGSATLGCASITSC